MPNRTVYIINFTSRARMWCWTRKDVGAPVPSWYAAVCLVAERLRCRQWNRLPQKSWRREICVIFLRIWRPMLSKWKQAPVTSASGNVHTSFFTRDSCTGRYCWERVLAIGILSVRLSVCPSVLVSRPGTESSPGEIETPGFHHMIA